jgi:hypothetical protein
MMLDRLGTERLAEERRADLCESMARVARRQPAQAARRTRVSPAHVARRWAQRSLRWRYSGAG